MRHKPRQEREAKWQGVSEAIMQVSGMHDWQREHPHASLREIEVALDERLAILRAQMLEESLRQREGSDWQQQPPAQRPCCAHCGTPLVARGRHARWLQSSRGNEVKLERTYGTCPTCGEGFFPPG